MNDIIKLIAIGGVATALTLILTACGEGHDHAAEALDDHALAEDDHGHDHATDDHGTERSLGSIEIASSTLSVILSGAMLPNAEMHVDIEHTAGPAPSGIRMWIGDESATGSLKIKTDAHDSHFHGHAEAPQTINGNTALWIEIETTSGERIAKSIQLK